VTILGIAAVSGILLGTAEGLRSFDKDIAPLWSSKECTGCHCSIFQFLCTYESMMKYTSETDERTKGVPIVNLADPDSSVILWRLKGRLPSGAEIDIMPVDLKPLTREEIGIVREWIAQGAPKSIVSVESTRWGEIKKLFR